MSGIPILLYHRLRQGHDQRDDMIVPVADFAAQLAYLAEQQFTVLSLDDAIALLRARRAPPPRGVVLTFDDGYAATCDYAEEALARHGYTATLFLTTDLVGQRDPLGSSDEGVLTWERLRALRHVTIQAHTVSHPRLSLLGRARVRHEVRQCRTVIEQELGRAIDHFSYPFGAYTRLVRDEVADAGYATACAVHRGLATRADDPFRLHRVTVDGRDSLAVFARQLATGYASPAEAVFARARDLAFTLPGVHDAFERRFGLRWHQLHTW